MKILLSVTLAVLTAAPGLALAAPKLRIEVPAARVVVIPEARKDIAVSATGGLGIRRSEEGVSVTASSPAGWLERAAPWLFGAGCSATGVTRWGQPVAAVPTITARVPLDADIVSSGAVFGQVAPGRGLYLAASGCGTWRLGRLSNGLVVTQYGSGRVVADHVDGLLAATVDGPGAILIKSGTASTADLRVKGSGAIHDRGTAGFLNARMDGSGLITVRMVTGQVKSNFSGDGDVQWGRPKGKKFCNGLACL